MKFETMTIKELEARNQLLMERRAKIKEEQKVIAQVLSEKCAQQSLEDDIAKLQERHGVKTQVVTPDSVPSAETVTGG